MPAWSFYMPLSSASCLGLQITLVTWQLRSQATLMVHGEVSVSTKSSNRLSYFWSIGSCLQRTVEFCSEIPRLWMMIHLQGLSRASTIRCAGSRGPRVREVRTVSWINYKAFSCSEILSNSQLFRSFLHDFSRALVTDCHTHGLLKNLNIYSHTGPEARSLHSRSYSLRL